MWKVFQTDFNLVKLQPLMLIVPDVEDVYTPLESDVIVQLSEVSTIYIRLLYYLYWRLRSLQGNI